MQWSDARIQLILGILLTVSGVAGFVGAFRRVPSSAQARAIRSADLLVYFGLAALGVAACFHDLPHWLRIAAPLVAVVCTGASVLLRRGAAVSFGS